jgi:hypothetical protein
VSNGFWLVYGPEEVFIDDESEFGIDPKKYRNGEWIGSEKEWRKLIDDNNLEVETSDEDYAIINNKAVYVGVAYDDYSDSYRGFEDDY